MIFLEKLKILTPLQKLPKNVGYLSKLIAAKDLKSCTKSNKLPNLVTLVTSSPPGTDKHELLDEGYLITFLEIFTK